ncbi:MAG: hypothetical protein COV44_00510 [Deltaproteobacteria bacterium CG11_big_fil_rev_8_21_14_0_20_45_16]|nr:MAG: hypothetical protein COV44_00510 [Deltaproteobacteria bacterium CG11_big_fil_rev_8_21_14_0_20_45_16]
MKNLAAFTTAALMLLGVACSQKNGEISDAQTADGLYAIQSIELSEANGQSRIVIKAPSELKYNVFKLADPERVMIDLIDAGTLESTPASIAGNELVSEIKVTPIQDSLSNLVRLEVYLNESSNYLAGMEEDGLVVRLIPVTAGIPNEDLSQTPSLESDEDLSSMEIPLLEEPLEEPQAQMGDSAPPALEDPSMESELALPEAPVLEPLEETPIEETPIPEMALKSEPEIIPEIPAPSEEIVPLPMPLPVPLPMEETKEEVAEAPEVLNEESLPEALPLPELAPEPLAQAEDNKVVVEPEPEPDVPVAPIITQEIPSSVLTEGTSLLSGMGGKVYTGKRVSLEFQDARVQDVLRLIAEVSKLNVIIADDVTGTITLKLVDVPWDQALDIILTSKGLDKVQAGNILRVAPIESLKKEREIALANDKAAKQLEPLRLKLFNINYAKAGDMKDRIKALLSERGTVDTDERTNTLIVEDIAETLSRMENLIAVLDTQTPQVRIESRIVQANDRFTQSLGIQWGPTLRLDGSNGHATDWQFPNTINVLTAPTTADGVASPAFISPEPGGLTDFAVDALPGNTVTGGSMGFRLGGISDVFNLDLRLSYAENEQMARVVSRPSITVLDNKTARIIQGSKIPFLSSSSEGSNVQFQEAGIQISVTPQITNDGSVILTVSTQSNEPGSEQVGGNPIINIREAQTDMLVKSGRTAVLGGVFKTSETKGKGGVPGLMNIPILGWLFKGQSESNNREEMLIFITPYILTDVREAQVSPSSDSPLMP